MHRYPKKPSGFRFVISLLSDWNIRKTIRDLMQIHHTDDSDHWLCIDSPLSLALSCASEKISVSFICKDKIGIFRTALASTEATLPGIYWSARIAQGLPPFFRISCQHDRSSTGLLIENDHRNHCMATSSLYVLKSSPCSSWVLAAVIRTSVGIFEAAHLKGRRTRACYTMPILHK